MKNKTFLKEGNELVTNRTLERSEQLAEVKEIMKANLDDLGILYRTHLPVFLGPGEIARILWFNYCFELIKDTPGCIIEFGSHFGASLQTLNNLRIIHDPFNSSRLVFSFSTFEEGFRNVDDKLDGISSNDDYATPASWKANIAKVAKLNESYSPLSGMLQIYEGDATITFEKFLIENPEIVISFAHFDMDIYKPTKKTLELVLDRMPKGGLLVFDEINHPGFPGETMALNEVLGIKNVKLKKTKFQPYSAYIIKE